MSSPKLSHDQSQAPEPLEHEAFEEDGVGVAEEIADTTKLLTPWAISFMFHFSLVLLALFVIWSSSAANEGETTVPVMNHQNPIKPKIDPIKPPDLPTIPSPQRKLREAKLKKGDPLAAPSDAEPTELSTIGASGSPSSFGHPEGTDDEGVGFIGLRSGSASRIVFVVDASGSMVESLPFVVNKLKESIRGMKGRAHQFAIIFYQNGSAIEVYDDSIGLKRGLKKANSENKRKAFHWLSSRHGRLIPKGASNPLEAIELAISYKPDTIFLLSDNITGSGQYAIYRDDLLESVRSAQDQVAGDSKKRIKMHTIQFLSEDPLNTLEMLAKENDGNFKYISPAFIGLQ